MMQRRYTVAVLLFAAILVPQLSQAADDLPAKLSDSEFWQLITGISEPNGRFQYENFVSNEFTLQSVIPSLKAQTKPAGAYIGVGPEQNFTYIAALHPKIAFIIDIRRQNLLEHLMYKAIFELSRNRSDLVSLLFSRKRVSPLSVSSTAGELLTAYSRVQGDRRLFDQNLRRIIHRLTIDHKFPLSDEDRNNIRYVYMTFFSHGPALDYTVGGFYTFDDPPTYIDLMTADDGQGRMRSFLATEENFQTVKTLETENLLIPVVGDFAGSHALREIGRFLAAHHSRVTAFYLSNVERYLFNAADAWRNFYVNVAILPYDFDSFFIRSVFDASYGSASMLSRIDDIMTAFSEGRLRTYTDVVHMSQ